METGFTKTEQLCLEGLEEGVAYLNMVAQRHLLGLDKEADDVRQKLCVGLSAARGIIICGNLQRTDETREAVKDALPFHQDYPYKRDVHVEVTEWLIKDPQDSFYHSVPLKMAVTLFPALMPFVPIIEENKDFDMTITYDGIKIKVNRIAREYA